MMPRPELQGSDDPEFDVPVVVMGTARLPAGALAEHPTPLMLELALDRLHGKIVDVATNIPLPGYNQMLRRLLVERCLSELDAVAERICAHCRGPLVKPTVAALKNAVAQACREAAVS